MPNLGPLSPLQAALGDYFQRLTCLDNTTTATFANMGIEGVVTITVADAATSDIDFTMPEKFEVTDVTCIKRNGAGAGNTMQIKNAATAISDAIACATDDAVTRAGSIVDGAGTNVIAAGGTLRLTATRAAGTRNCQVFVYGVIRP